MAFCGVTGEKVLCFHGPLIYEAKALRSMVTKDKQVKYFIHYAGWNKKWVYTAENKCRSIKMCLFGTVGTNGCRKIECSNTTRQTSNDKRRCRSNMRRRLLGTKNVSNKFCLRLLRRGTKIIHCVISSNAEKQEDWRQRGKREGRGLAGIYTFERGCERGQHPCGAVYLE